jgi:hypothetical protein
MCKPVKNEYDDNHVLYEALYLNTILNECAIATRAGKYTEHSTCDMDFLVGCGFTKDISNGSGTYQTTPFGNRVADCPYDLAIPFWLALARNQMYENTNENGECYVAEEMTVYGWDFLGENSHLLGYWRRILSTLH